MARRYASVSKMLTDLSGDDQFNKEFSELVAERRIVKQLIAMRAVRGVSQADVADVLGVTQSRVSKIESGVDDDLRLGDLKAYAQAFDMNVGLVLAKGNQTIVDDVKFHAFRIKHLLDRMAKLAEQDDGIAHGVTKFFGELFVNFVNFIQESAARLPRRAEDQRPRICIQIQELEVEGLPDDDARDASRDHVVAGESAEEREKSAASRTLPACPGSTQSVGPSRETRSRRDRST